MIKKFLLVAALGVMAVATPLVGYIVWAINPFNVPAIFKRNYPEAFEKAPLSYISPFIKIY